MRTMQWVHAVGRHFWNLQWVAIFGISRQNPGPPAQGREGGFSGEGPLPALPKTGSRPSGFTPLDTAAARCTEIEILRI